MKDSLFIIKVGGNVIDDEKALDDFLETFKNLGEQKILVHGGGKIAAGIAERMGYQTVMVEGRRITDSNMLEVVTMVYGGLVNKNLVSRLQSIGINAVGLTGADGNLILSNKRPKTDDIDFGWVGDPETINAGLLTKLLDAGMTPVIAPLTHDGKGNMLNTNADTMANRIAVGISEDYEVHLVYVLDLPGVLRDIKDRSSLISDINEEHYQQLKDKGQISKGMIPKLDNAFWALEGGVKSVRIAHFESIAKLNQADYHDYTLVH